MGNHNLILKVKPADLSVETVEKQGLTDAVSSVPAQGNKSDEAFTKLTAAKDAAQAVVDRADATKSEVSAAIKAVQEAVADFTASADVTPGTPGTNPRTPGTPGTNPENPGTPGTPGVTVDVTGLQKALEKAAAITQGVKTNGAWEALQNAIRAAQEILDNGPSSQAVVDEGVTALTTAVNVFNASPDKTGGYVVAIADMKAGHMYEVPFAIHK